MTDAPRLPSMKLPRIQLLRFFAAAVVVAFHALGTASHYFKGASGLEIFHYGDLGVDLFFVISGFIIYLTVSSRETDWRTFLSRRLWRIVPMYWLATATMTMLLMIPGPSRTAPPDIGYILQSLLYLGWTTQRMPIIFPGWSLEFEMLFYALVTTALALAPRRWTDVTLVIAGAVIVGVGLRMLGVSNAFTIFLTDPLQIEFGLGIVLAHWVLRREVLWMPLIGLCVAIAVVAIGPAEERLWRVLIAGVPSVLLVGGAALRDGVRPLTGWVWNALVKLGDASYSIYLTHVLVISIAAKILQRLVPGTPVDLAIVMLFVAAVAASYIVHLCVEKPLSAWVHRRTRRPEAEPARRTQPSDSLSS